MAGSIPVLQKNVLYPLPVKDLLVYPIYSELPVLILFMVPRQKQKIWA